MCKFLGSSEEASGHISLLLDPILEQDQQKREWVLDLQAAIKDYGDAREEEGKKKIVQVVADEIIQRFCH